MLRSVGDRGNHRCWRIWITVMEKEELKVVLERLRAQLESADEVDPELEALLRDLDRDIHDVLERDEAGQSEADSLLEQAQAVDAKFAARHPQIEATFRELVNALARMGI